MENSYRIEKVDPLTYSEEDWIRYYNFRKKSYALINERMPFGSIEGLKELNTKNILEHGEELYIVWKNEEENGIFFFSVRFKDDLRKRFTYLESYLNDRYLESNLLEKIFRKYINYDHKSNSLAILSRDGKNDYIEAKFAAHAGAKADFYELKVKEMHLSKIDINLKEGFNKFPNLRMEFYDEIPDDLLEEYAAVFTQLLDDIPAMTELGETTTARSVKDLQEAHKLRNYCVYSYLIFNEKDNLIAQTNVCINRKDPKEMEQWMTGVLEEYRGQGLGKWIKAAMLKKLLSDYPGLEKMETEIHPDNHPSIKLNKQMGYRKTGFQKEFLINRSGIVDYLDI